jgi:hypothetical protein
MNDKETVFQSMNRESDLVFICWFISKNRSLLSFVPFCNKQFSTFFFEVSKNSSFFVAANGADKKLKMEFVITNENAFSRLERVA